MYVSDKQVKYGVDLFKENGGVMKTSEVLDQGLHSRTLYWMEEKGVLEKMERGVFKLADMNSLSNPDLTIVATRIPSAILCLISALDFHDLTEEIPHKVHIALPRSKRTPQLNHPPLEVYRFSGESRTAGIEYYKLDGVRIQVYNPAKTIADCFKFRNKIGLDIAIEALKRGIEGRKASFEEIVEFANICRVGKVIQPYLETAAHE